MKNNQKNLIFTIQDQIRIEELTQQTKQLYSQLKSCQHPPIQATIIWSLKPKCQQLLDLLAKEGEKSGTLIKIKKIIQIKNKIEEVQKKIEQQEIIHPQIGHGGRPINVNQDYTMEDLKFQIGSTQTEQLDLLETINRKAQQTDIKQSEDQRFDRLSREILKQIAMTQIAQTDLKYTKQQLEEVLQRMKKNQQVMETIKSLIVEQGKKIDVVENNLQKTNQNVKETNKELGQAQKQQLKMIKKIRKIFKNSATGFWGFIKWPFKKMFGRKTTTTV